MRHRMVAEAQPNELTPQGVVWQHGRSPYQARADHDDAAQSERNALIVDRLITLGKRGDLHARRIAVARLHEDKKLADKLFTTLADRYRDRPAGIRG